MTPPASPLIGWPLALPAATPATKIASLPTHTAAAMPTPRQLFVTTALPYANGNFHIGHIMEYIQADIWVRFQRMQGSQVNFVGADDTHGAPIMIAAEKAGKTPQQFVADIAAGRKPYLDGFHIQFDNWHSTDAPENHELARQIYRDLRDISAADGGSLIEVRAVEQFFDPQKNMFLPDRFIKGECPKCHAKDQYGDNCEVCGAVYAPTDLINPFSALSGAKPELKTSEHFFFKLSDPRCVDFLSQWTQDGKLQPEVANKVKEWFSVRTNPDGTTSEGLGDWDISRDAPYFGIEIPDAPGKYFYVWLDAPVGYLASSEKPARQTRRELRGLHGQPRAGAVPLHRQRHRHLPHAVLASHAAFFWPQNAQQRVRARLPDGEQRREDEQEPRHGPGPAQVPEPGHEPRVAALLPGGQTLGPQRRHRLQRRRLHGAGQQRFDRQVCQHRFALGRLHRQALWRPTRPSERRRPSPAGSALQAATPSIAASYEQREYAKALREIMLLTDKVNSYVDQNKPWDLAKQEGQDARLHDVCTTCIEAFRLLSACYSNPCCPLWPRRSRPS